MFDSMKVYERIKKYPVISFDIFDTLVKRNVSEPKAIFDVVEERFNRQHPGDCIQEFREKRIQAERTARMLSAREEVTFRQIYDQLDLSSWLCDELMHFEAEIELQYCQPNYILKELYERCISEGHTVIITSDMYLPQEIVLKILEKCGYAGYRKLYLSSEIGLQKRTGSLFDYLIHDLNVPAKDIVHVGDSKKTDNLIPRLKGMGNLYIERQHLYTNFLQKKDVFEANSSFFVFLNNNLPKYRFEPKLFQWGYETLGPLLLGFTTWVHEQIVEEGIERAYFLARDMYLVIEIYRKLYGNENIEYLEVSRKSLRAAYVRKAAHIAAVFDTMSRRAYTVGELLDALDIDSNELDVDLAAEISSKIVEQEQYGQLNDAIMDALNRKEDLTEEYLIQMGLSENEKTAIIDIGWHGTIQNMLETLIGNPLLGLYFGSTVRRSFRKMTAHGYWFSFDDETMASPFLSMTFILEVMLFPQIGTTTGYTRRNGSISPQHALCETHNYELIEQLQSGAMKFVDDFMKSELCGQQIKRNEAVKAFQNLAFEPTLIQAKTFANIPYEEGKVYSLASSQSIWHYLFQPIYLLKDYKAARWKEGFIKQVTPFVRKPHKIVVLGRNLKQRND